MRLANNDVDIGQHCRPGPEVFISPHFRNAFPDFGGLPGTTKMQNKGKS